MNGLETVKIVGAILGIIAFFWRVKDHFTSYLHCDLSVLKNNKNDISANTSVENKGVSKKVIENALILVGPESESPIVTFNKLAPDKKSVNYTNDIAKIRLKEKYIDNEGRQIIPLPFYYSENVHIGDETISYRAPIDTQPMKSGEIYSVRFYIYGEGRLHRSTHDSFRFEKEGNKKLNLF